MSTRSLLVRPSLPADAKRNRTNRVASVACECDRLLTTAYRLRRPVRPMRQSVTDRGKSDPGSEETQPGRRCPSWFDLPQETVEWDGAGAGGRVGITRCLSVCRWHCTASRSQRSFVPLADHPRCVCRSPIGVPNSSMMKHIKHKMWFCIMYRDRLKNGP